MKIITTLALLYLVAPLGAQDKAVFRPDSEWETVTTGHQFAEGMAFDEDGHFYFTDVPRRQLFKIVKGGTEKVLVDGDTGGANGIGFGPDGRLYGCANRERKIYAWDPATWEKTVISDDVSSNDIAIHKDGTLFFTDPPNKCVWRVSPEGWKRDKAVDLSWKPNGITISLDFKTLYVAEFSSDTIHAFPIEVDHSLGEGQDGFIVDVPQGKEGSLDGMMIHDDGRLLSGTKFGLQIASPFKEGTERNVIVFPIPNNLPRCNYVRICPNKKWLYAAHAKSILRRELDPSFSKPTQP